MATKEGKSDGGSSSSSSTSQTAKPDSYNTLLQHKLQVIPPTLSKHLIAPPQEILTEIMNFTKPSHSIEKIALHLLSKNMIQTYPQEESLHHALTTVFLLLGWKTMLYPPSIGTSPPPYLALEDILDGFPSQVYMTLKQDLSRVKLPISDFLLGFGLMLPKENLCLSAEKEDIEAFEKITIVRPTELNAKLLWDLARIKVRWVDVLAPHLEFDAETRTVFLFRHAAFVRDCLDGDGGDDAGRLLYSCASQHQDSSSGGHPEITQLLNEILLSYRLLFGQTKASRKLFLKECHHNDDTFLAHLCTSSTSPKDKHYYRLPRHFPILRNRLAILQYQMTILKPRGWRDLWQDRRDSAQWLTFWAVLVIGGSGVLLAFVQVILQAVQLGGGGG